MASIVSHEASWTLNDQDLPLKRGPSRLSYLISAAFLLVFVLLFLGLQLGATTSVDLAMLRATHRLAAPGTTRIMEAVTYLGSWPVIAVLLGLFVWRNRSRHPHSVRILILAVLGGSIGSLTLKLLVRRPRPDLFPALVHVSSFSFPSGHAIISLVFYGSLGHLLADHASSPRLRAAIYVATGLMILAIGYSRLYLGVHYLTDILAGYALGAAWISFLVLNQRRHRYPRI